MKNTTLILIIFIIILIIFLLQIKNKDNLVVNVDSSIPSYGYKNIGEVYNYPSCKSENKLCVTTNTSKLKPEFSYNFDDTIRCVKNNNNKYNISDTELNNLYTNYTTPNTSFTSCQTDINTILPYISGRYIRIVGNLNIPIKISNISVYNRNTNSNTSNILSNLGTNVTTFTEPVNSVSNVLQYSDNVLNSSSYNTFVTGVSSYIQIDLGQNILISYIKINHNTIEDANTLNGAYILILRDYDTIDETAEVVFYYQFNNSLLERIIYTHSNSVVPSNINNPMSIIRNYYLPCTGCNSYNGCLNNSGCSGTTGCCSIYTDFYNNLFKNHKYNYMPDNRCFKVKELGTNKNILHDSIDYNIPDIDIERYFASCEPTNSTLYTYTTGRYIKIMKYGDANLSKSIRFNHISVNYIDRSNTNNRYPITGNDVIISTYPSNVSGANINPYLTLTYNYPDVAFNNTVIDTSTLFYSSVYSPSVLIDLEKNNEITFIRINAQDLTTRNTLLNCHIFILKTNNELDEVGDVVFYTTIKLNHFKQLPDLSWDCIIHMGPIVDTIPLDMPPDYKSVIFTHRVGCRNCTGCDLYKQVCTGCNNYNNKECRQSIDCNLFNSCTGTNCPINNIQGCSNNSRCMVKTMRGCRNKPNVTSSTNCGNIDISLCDQYFQCQSYDVMNCTGMLGCNNYNGNICTQYTGCYLTNSLRCYSDSICQSNGPSTCNSITGCYLYNVPCTGTISCTNFNFTRLNCGDCTGCNECIQSNNNCNNCGLCNVTGCNTYISCSGCTGCSQNLLNCTGCSNCMSNYYSCVNSTDTCCKKCPTCSNSKNKLYKNHKYINTITNTCYKAKDNITDVQILDKLMMNSLSKIDMDKYFISCNPIINTFSSTEGTYIYIPFSTFPNYLFKTDAGYENCKITYYNSLSQTGIDNMIPPIDYRDVGLSKDLTKHTSYFGNNNSYSYVTISNTNNLLMIGSGVSFTIQFDIKFSRKYAMSTFDTNIPFYEHIVSISELDKFNSMIVTSFGIIYKTNGWIISNPVDINLSTNKWYNITIRKDGYYPYIHVHIDNNRIPSYSYNGSNDLFNMSNLPLYIGNSKYNTNLSDTWFNGWMSDFIFIKGISTYNKINTMFN